MRSLAARAVKRPVTSPPRSPSGEARLTRLSINGELQWLLIRGEPRDAPVILFLHGGPGMPSMYLSRLWAGGLEREALLVQWDRYGAGKSWTWRRETGRLRTSREVDDAIALITHLQATYRTGPVIVLGHSYGAYLAVALARRRPDLVRALIAVSPMTGSHAAELVHQDAWLRDRAETAADRRLLARLDDARAWDRGPDVFRYGGGVVGLAAPFTLGALALEAPEYSLMDLLRLASGIRDAHCHFVMDGPALPLMDNAIHFEMPVHVVIGAQDRITSIDTVRPWFDALQAPDKTWTILDHSAHLPFIEEPDRFATIIGSLVNPAD